jgi:hypothetical protein
LKGVNTGPITGSVVTFKLGTGSGAQTCNSATDSTGTASCTISAVAQLLGSGTVAASFAGDQNNISSSTSATIQISPPATTLVYTGDTSTMYLVAPKLAAKLTDKVTGKPLAGKLVSFTVGNATYNDFTDSGGIASVRGPANLTGTSFTVTVNFAGDNSYAASTISVTVNITPRSTVLTYTGDTSKQFGFAPTLAAKLSDKLNGSPLAGRKVTFVFNGTSTTAMTDSRGVASAPAPAQFSLGSYPVTASYAGEQDYSSSQTAAVVKVVNSEGQVIGSGNNNKSFLDSSGGTGSFSVQADDHGVSGQLQYQNGSFKFHSSKMTALGISADSKAAWFAGIGDDGQTTFIAYVEDNSFSGKRDVFKIWIGGTLFNGDGTLTSGNIQINKSGPWADIDDEDDRNADMGGFSGGSSSGDVYDDHGGHCTFSLASDGHRERGDFLYKNGSVNFHSSTMTTLSVSQDGLYAWLSGFGDDGRTFVAYVEDNSQSGKSGKFQLWINGAPQDDGTLKSGTIQVHKKS